MSRATSKPKPVPDSLLAQVLNMWSNKAEKNYIHENKTIFLCNGLGKLKLSVEKNNIFFY